LANESRVDCASRIIKAPRRTIYQAFMDPDAVASWLPPKGMKGAVETYDARNCGAFRMSLTFLGSDHAQRGKTSEHTDVVQGHFAELIADTRIVQQVEFESRDPSFAGTMTMTWTMNDVPGGTEVTVRAENVPQGISPKDHETGMRSSLENLAAFTE
jgi:uncharacterized protein YndB with AHSA1/START domain